MVHARRSGSSWLIKKHPLCDSLRSRRLCVKKYCSGTSKFSCSSVQSSAVPLFWHFEILLFICSVLCGSPVLALRNSPVHLFSHLRFPCSGTSKFSCSSVQSSAVPMFNPLRFPDSGSVSICAICG